MTMKSLSFSLSLSLLLLLALLDGCDKSAGVLVVVGGHAYDTAAFYDMFDSMEDIRFDSVSYPNAREKLKSAGLEAYDVLVFYDYIPDMPQRDSSIFINLAKKGKPMLFLHHSICSFQEWDGYMQMIGGKYVIPQFSEDTALWSNYEHGIDLYVEVLDTIHPITRGIRNFTIHDEGYSNITLLNGVHPLLRTDHPDCTPVVGWTNKYDNASTVYLIFGHDQMAYENDTYRLLLRNSILWLKDQQ